MSKVRPWYGHADHIHVRLEECPADSPGDCRAPMPPVPKGKMVVISRSTVVRPDGSFYVSQFPTSFSPSAAGLKLKDLPPACAAVLNAPGKTRPVRGDGRRVGAEGENVRFGSEAGTSAGCAASSRPAYPEETGLSITTKTKKRSV